jgi:hypothetical protein
MSTKSHIHKRRGTLRENLFSTRGYAEIHIQRQFFDNTKGISKIVVLKIQMVNIYSHASSTYIIYFFEKYKNLNYWWYFKVPEATSLWARFGKT